MVILLCDEDFHLGKVKLRSWELGIGNFLLRLKKASADEEELGLFWPLGEMLLYLGTCQNMTLGLLLWGKIFWFFLDGRSWIVSVLIFIVLWLLVIS